MPGRRACGQARREWLKSAGMLGLGNAASTGMLPAAPGEAGALAVETPEPPVLEINPDPQLFMDDYLVDKSGTNGGHNRRSQDIDPGIGLARLRKEGFVSLRSPAGGGVVVTRLLRWPGGRLEVNADAGQGELTVRITDYNRKPLANFDPQLSLPAVGNSIRHEVKWGNRHTGDLKGQAIRLEFRMRGSVDLYGFRAVPEGE